MLNTFLHNFCIYLYVMVAHKQNTLLSFSGLQGLFKKLRACVWLYQGTIMKFHPKFFQI